MRWLIGQDDKSYTAFSGPAVSAQPGKLVVFTRDMERNEFERDSMIDEVRGYNGREPEDPMEAFSKFANDLGLGSAQVGIEVPSWYLNAHQYVKLKDILGKALVREPSGLVHGLKLAKSPAEIAYHRKSAAIAAATPGVR